MVITQNISTAYHPRTDGQLERSNQWLEQYLCFWVDHQQTNWHHYLPLAEFAHNSWKNEAMGQSTFEILMGYSPRAEIFDVTSSIPTIALRLRDWKRAREEAQKLMIKAQKKWTKGKELEQKYKTGDQVWLVTLGPGVHLDVRFLGVASVLRLLLLPPATQICGKRVFGMTEGIDGVW